MNHILFVLLKEAGEMEDSVDKFLRFLNRFMAVTLEIQKDLPWSSYLIIVSINIICHVKMIL